MNSEGALYRDMQALPEIDAGSVEEMRPHMAQNSPFIVRGLSKDWPLVKAGLLSAEAARQYLLEKANDIPFVVGMGAPDYKGRMFYREDMSMNVQLGKAKLPAVFDRIRAVEKEENPPIIYLSSVNMRKFFTGLCEENSLDLDGVEPLESIWIGTRTRVAAHNDFPDNIACVAVGKRRFTLFPPEQFRNLYIGPVDNTPAGRAISMVDFESPDFGKFPKFRNALDAGLTAILGPGDAIFIPSMWWHQVEGLSPFNVLVNYWWRETPRYLGGPQNALNHAMMAIRELPVEERKHWQDLFDYYVFENDPSVTAHIPEQGRGILGPMDAQNAARIRSFLIKMLNNE